MVVNLHVGAGVEPQTSGRPSSAFTNTEPILQSQEDPSWLWAEPFPRQGILDCVQWAKVNWVYVYPFPFLNSAWQCDLLHEALDTVHTLLWWTITWTVSLSFKLVLSEYPHHPNRKRNKGTTEKTWLIKHFFPVAEGLTAPDGIATFADIKALPDTVEQSGNWAFQVGHGIYTIKSRAWGLDG